ncbi:MAG: DUF3343 domain-containing protein [Sphaerochaeta sp.]
MDYLLTFHTQLDAVIARKSLTSKNIKIKLAPVPRALSSSCGTCARAYSVSKDDLRGINMESLYIIKDEKYIEDQI